MPEVQILRPLSTSQVLDRTFSLYRQNFILFADQRVRKEAFDLQLMMEAIGPALLPAAAAAYPSAG